MNQIVEISGTSGGGQKIAKARKWWILLLLPFLVIAVVLVLLLGQGRQFERVPSDFGFEDIRISEDGLTQEVGNRIILLLPDEKTLRKFEKAFRKQYPDKARYQLSYPDKSFPRLVLVLPPNERDQVMESLPLDFADYDLLAYPDAIYQTNSIPSDPDFSGLKERWYFDMIGVYDAWDDTFGDKKVTVAVVDGCFDLSHPELQGKAIRTYNAVTQSTQLTTPTDEHATHIAATAIGNANNGTGVSGVAPGCSLIAIQVENAAGQISSSALVDGLLYAISSGADVINLSLGGALRSVAPLPPAAQEDIMHNAFLNEERMWNRIFEKAFENNVTVVQAGGNDNILVGVEPTTRSSKTIKVSAVQPNLLKADFSNYGYNSTLSAPGVAIYNAVPGNKYDYLDGTSMAAPIVTGAIALLKSKHPGLLTAQAVKILQDTGTPSPSDVGVIINLSKAMAAAVPDLPANSASFASSYLADNPPPRRRKPRSTSGSSPDFPGGVSAYPTNPYWEGPISPGSGQPATGSPYIGNDPYGDPSGGVNNPSNGGGPYGNPSGGVNNPSNGGGPYGNPSGGVNNPSNGGGPYGNPSGGVNNPSNGGGPYGNPSGGASSWTPWTPPINPANPGFGSDPLDPCATARARYKALMDELERLRRECPECFTTQSKSFQR